MFWLRSESLESEGGRGWGRELPEKTRMPSFAVEEVVTELLL
jgi:hypothetical protein